MVRPGGRNSSQFGIRQRSGINSSRSFNASFGSDDEMNPLSDSHPLLDEEKEGKICGLSCLLIIAVTIMIWSITTIDAARSTNREVELELFADDEKLWNETYRNEMKNLQINIIKDQSLYLQNPNLKGLKIPLSYSEDLDEATLLNQ